MGEERSGGGEEGGRRGGGVGEWRTLTCPENSDSRFFIR